MRRILNHLSVQRDAPIGAAIAALLATVVVAPTMTDILFWTLVALAVRARFWRPVPRLERMDWLVLMVLSAWPLAVIGIELIHGPLLSALDRPSRMLLLPVLFLMFRSHPVQLEWIGWGCLAGVVAGIGTHGFNVYVSYDGLLRAQSFAGNPISYGQFMLALGVLGGGCWLLRSSSAGSRAAALACLSFGIAGAYLSGTRGVLLAVPPLLIALAFLTHHRHTSAVLATCLVTGLALAWTISPSLSERIFEAITLLSGGRPEVVPLYEETSLGHRLRLWSIGWTLFRDSPWIGVGAEELRELLQSLGSKGSIEVGRVHLHNEWIHTLTTCGLLGLLGLSVTLLGLFAIFWSGHGKSRTLAGPVPGSARHGALLGVLLMTALVVFSLSDSLLSNMNRVELYTVLLAVCAGAARNNAMNQPSARSESQDSQAGHCQA